MPSERRVFHLEKGEATAGAIRKIVAQVPEASIVKINLYFSGDIKEVVILEPEDVKPDETRDVGNAF